MRIAKENTIGLIIDIQERLYPAMWKKEKFLHNCTVFLKGLGILNVPVLATQQYTNGLGETLPEIKLLVSDFNHIEKRAFSCCDETGFTKKLKESGARNVLICGIESHVCVMQTAVDLKEAGFNAVVVTDCISSRSKNSVSIAKERFRFEGIMMTSYESILFELTQTSGAEEFKAISQLVK